MDSNFNYILHDNLKSFYDPTVNWNHTAAI